MTDQETQTPTQPGQALSDEDRAALQRLHAIQAQARPAEQPEPEPLYNLPDRLYSRSDGDVVTLQDGLPARSYWARKGYYRLTDQEIADYRANLRPIVLSEQRKRAQLIGLLRRIAKDNSREVQLNEDRHQLDDYSTEELEAFLAQVRASITNVAVLTGPARPSPAMEARERAMELAEKKLQEGVEMGDGGRLADRVMKGKRPGGRTVPPGTVAESL